MPRFIARPIVIEAHQFRGNSVGMPENFRMAIVGYRPAGGCDVMTGDGLRPCMHNNWIMRGPDGQFSVVKQSAFEQMFQEQTPTVAELDRRRLRKEIADV
jgi:hypothetical protein